MITFFIIFKILHRYSIGMPMFVCDALIVNFVFILFIKNRMRAKGCRYVQNNQINVDLLNVNDKYICSPFLRAPKKKCFKFIVTHIYECRIRGAFQKCVIICLAKKKLFRARRLYHRVVSIPAAGRPKMMRFYMERVERCVTNNRRFISTLGHVCVPLPYIPKSYLVLENIYENYVFIAFTVLLDLIRACGRKSLNKSLARSLFPRALLSWQPPYLRICCMYVYMYTNRICM